MSAASPLPFPRIGQPPTCCGLCGYDLAALPFPGRCPECGTDYEAWVVECVGIAKNHESMPLIRRLAWLYALGIPSSFFAFWPVWFILARAFPGAWLLVAAVFLSAIGLAAYLLITRRGEGRGTERFIITSTGVFRTPYQRRIETSPTSSDFHPWTAPARVVMHSVSSVWATVRIVPADTPHAKPMFAAGIRCERDRIAEVGAAIDALLGHPATGPHPVNGMRTPFLDSGVPLPDPAQIKPP